MSYRSRKAGHVVVDDDTRLSALVSSATATPTKSSALSASVDSDDDVER
jgi:hypothetical protein